MTGCKVSGCTEPHRSTGFCASHHYRWKRHGDPLAGRSRAGPGVPQKWIQDNANYQGDDCLKWPFAITRLGYGDVRIDGRHCVASRQMCIAAHGEPPTPDHDAAHSCGNGHLAYMNQKHLRWATVKENVADTIKHGRKAVGERSGTAKVSEGKVRSIRSLIRAGVTQTSVAQMFGISQAQVWSIKERRSWRHVA